MTEINSVLATLDADPTIGAIVITGSEKAFAGKDHALLLPFLPVGIAPFAGAHRLAPIAWRA